MLTGQCAFSASAAAVDPRSSRATAPIPTDPTQTNQGGGRDWSIRTALLTASPQDVRLDLDRLPGGLHRGRRGAQRRLGVFDLEADVLGRLFLDAGDMNYA